MRCLMNLINRSIRKVKKDWKSKKSNNKNLLPSKKQLRAVSSSLDDNLKFIAELTGHDDDVIIGKFMIMGGQKKAGVVYISGMADEKIVNEQIISRLKNLTEKNEKNIKNPSKHCFEFIKEHLLTTANVKETDRMEQVMEAMLIGNTVIFVDGIDAAVITGTRKFEKRAIEKPINESTVLGSKESFVEDINTNCMMLRRRLPSPDLRFESFTIGRVSHTKVKLAWIEGLANPKIIEEVRRRIQRIDIDYIFGSAAITELIEDNPLSVWPQYKLTERPDVLAPNLTEGRFALFCDGTPYVIMAPSLIMQHLETYDDYAERPIMGAFLRLLHIIAFCIAILLSPLYLSFVAYNHSIIPLDLAIQIASGRATVPFPSIVEIIVMTGLIDFLREAGLRSTKSVGSALGILGAVVLGQAAVAAGYVSAALVIVTAITAMANFAIPSGTFSGSTRVINYFFIILAGFLGIFGLVFGMVLLMWRLVSLRSFGISIFYPIAPGESHGIINTLIRSPIWRQRKRPSLLAPYNQERMGKSTKKPSPKNTSGNS